MDIGMESVENFYGWIKFVEGRRKDVMWDYDSFRGWHYAAAPDLKRFSYPAAGLR